MAPGRRIADGIINQYVQRPLQHGLISDMVAWKTCSTEFVEIAPTTVKKTLTGSGKAGKEEVAAVLERYVGRQEYATDDESDAVAVGVTWMILNHYISK